MSTQPTVRDIPDGTYWMKDSQDRWVIRRVGTGKLLAAEVTLQAAIKKARAAMLKVQP